MIERLILIIFVAGIVAAIFKLEAWRPLLVFAIPTAVYSVMPHSSGVMGFVFAGLFDAVIITTMYLMPRSVKSLTLAKNLVVLSLISLALTISGLFFHGILAPVWLDNAYIVLYVVALISIVTGTGYGLRKGGGSSFLTLDRQHGYKFCARGDNL